MDSYLFPWIIDTTSFAIFLVNQIISGSSLTINVEHLAELDFEIESYDFIFGYLESLNILFRK